MSRYIERDTELEVDVTCIMSYRGEPIGAIVTFPDGMRYSLPADRMDVYFDIVTPQNITIEAVANMQYDRTGPLPGVRIPRPMTDGDLDAVKLRQHAEELVVELDKARAERDVLQTAVAERDHLKLQLQEATRARIADPLEAQEAGNAERALRPSQQPKSDG
jgi:hypothetical protein